MPEFEPGQHHKIICEALEQVESGELKRLMIFAPPRHTKSELGSRRFPAWYLGRNPNKQIIATTYGHDFAADFGRDVRSIVQTEEYGRLFETRLSADSKSANRWHTDAGGVYISTGVGGAITGRGAHIALIDDPFKNRDEADSEVFRDRVWKWYTSTLYTRLMPGGAIVIILTRWHEDDLAGRLIEAQQQGGDQWHIISLQAIADEDTKNERALWPEWYPVDVLKQTKAVIGPRDWSALYQQEPKPIEGTFFKREWFKRHYAQDLPQHVNRYISTDFAVSDADSADYTELGVFALDTEMDIWIEAWWYGQETADIWIDALLDLVKEHKPLCVFGESGVIRRSIEPFLIKQRNARKIYFRQEWIARSSNKAAMARAFQALAAAGKVHIPYSEWGDRLIEQLCSFPAAKNDDAVDVCALIGLALDEQHEAISPTTPRDKPKDTWGRPKGNTTSWRTM